MSINIQSMQIFGKQYTFKNKTELVLVISVEFVLELSKLMTRFSNGLKIHSTHRRGVSQTEGCILQRLHFSAATSSNVAEGHLNRKDPRKTAFVSHPSFS